MAQDFIDDIDENNEDDEETMTSSSSGRGSFNTIKPEPEKKRWSYSTRMAFMFALTAAMTAVLFIVVLAVVWDGQFKAYTRQNTQAIAESAANAISAEYSAQGGWTDEVVSAAESISATIPDLEFELLDVGGNEVYSTADDGIVEAPVGTDAMVTADVHDRSGSVVGYVHLWVSGDDSPLTPGDAQFLTSSYSAIIFAGIVATVVAVLIGYFVSRSLTKPIQRITKTAKQIRNGDLTARTGLSGTDEIGQLGETFDDMAAKLERDIKLEHRITSDIAHELRTPLMAIQATVEAMQDGVLPADDEHFETVASEVRHLSRLIDAMLRLSRLENGTAKLNLERTDLVYLVKGLVGTQHQLFHEKGLHLRFTDETPHNECFADVDPDMIREAVANLMSNAMRYTDKGGWVVVSVGIERSNAVIAVRDTGIGMAKDDIPQVFSRFWRSDVSRERVTGGLGVGLSITKEIVDLHNGTISVDSELGKGSTFTICIPQNRPRRARKQAGQEKQGQQPQKSPAQKQ